MATKKTANTDSEPYLKITAQRKIRRAGCEWVGTTWVPMNAFTEAQIQQLDDEPLLQVEIEQQLKTDAATDA